MDLNEKILDRLHELYQDLPIEYCGYVLSAIADIERMMYGPVRKDEGKVSR